jgi:TPR repeat protein
MTVEELLKQGDDLRHAAEAEADREIKYQKQRNAFFYYKAAAGRDSGEARFRMGMAYYRGEGAPGMASPQAALGNFEIAANELGHGEAAEWAGRLYLTERVWESTLGEWRPLFPNNVPNAIKYLNLAIERGCISAKEPLAQMHADGNGVEWDLAKAFALRVEVAAAGKLSPEGWCRLGEMHRDGLGTSKNIEEATKCFQTALDARFLLGATRLGQLRMTQTNPPDVAAAIALFEQAKEGNEPEGMTELATLTANGEGVEKDPAAALKILAEAVKMNYGGAMHAMGLLHMKGVGVKRDLGTAVIWFDRGASNGCSESMLVLGEMYLFGKGRTVSRDPSRALSFFNKAATAGNVKGMRLLSDALWAGKICDADPSNAAGWCKRAAQLGDVSAMNRTGHSYLIGDGVRRDPAEAMRWFRLAADQGSVDAMANLGNMLFRGLGTPSDLVEAEQWYQRAADAGHAQAMLWIATSYFEGIGKPKDVNQGITWLKKCAQEKSAAPAMRELARILMEGNGIDKDEAAGMDWLVKAAEAGDGPAMFILGSEYLDGTRVANNQDTAESWFVRAAEAGDGRAALAMGVLTSARLKEDDFRGDLPDSRGGQERPLASAAGWFRRAQRLGCPTPKEYLGVVKAEAAIQKARKEKAAAEASASMMKLANLPEYGGLRRNGLEWANMATHGSDRRAADAAYDAMAAERDFRSQTAAYLGSLGLEWREGDR